MLILKEARSFKTDRKKLNKNQKEKLLEVINVLLEQEVLNPKYLDHPLKGDYVGRRECHVEPDLLMVCKISVPHLHLEQIASHSELF